MSKASRLSEKWFRRALWLIAFIFASFLIGLGGNIINDLPKIETELRLDDFIDQAQIQPLRTDIKQLQSEKHEIQMKIDQARLAYNRARSDTLTAQESLNNWLATRSATQKPETDPEIIRRNIALDELKIAERQTEQQVQVLEQQKLDIDQGISNNNRQIQSLETAGYKMLYKANQSLELRVFLYRLALTLPLLLLAAWLFLRKRQSRYWPFVWGFIYFAAFAFFFELVPYLPSYGGYVRSAVGVLATVLIGKWAIGALQKYLDRQKQSENLSDSERRQDISYDKAVASLQKSICPGCERKVPLDDGVTDYCPHCGICLFNSCNNCNSRKNSFMHFCHHCGAK